MARLPVPCHLLDLVLVLDHDRLGPDIHVRLNCLKIPLDSLFQMRYGMFVLRLQLVLMIFEKMGALMCL
jgi:hypothetical protein